MQHTPTRSLVAPTGAHTTSQPRLERKVPPVAAPPPSQELSDEEEFEKLLEIKADPSQGYAMVLRDISIPSSFRRAVLAKCLQSRGQGQLSLRSNQASGHGWEDYSLRITTAGAVSTTGAGVNASAFVCDPSVFPLTDWTAFAALFDEVKLTGFEVIVAPYGSNHTSASITSIALGSFLSRTSVPANIVDVLTAPDGCLVSPLMSVPHRQVMRVPELLFAPTSSPGGSTSMGCPGSISLYLTATAVSTGVLTYAVVGRYHLRGRL